MGSAGLIDAGAADGSTWRARRGHLPIVPGRADRTPSVPAAVPTSTTLTVPETRAARRSAPAGPNCGVEARVSDRTGNAVLGS